LARPAYTRPMTRAARLSDAAVHTAADSAGPPRSERESRGGTPASGFSPPTPPPTKPSTPSCSPPKTAPRHVISPNATAPERTCRRRRRTVALGVHQRRRNHSLQGTPKAPLHSVSPSEASGLKSKACEGPQRCGHEGCLCGDGNSSSGYGVARR
jgi:hypothetical protein